MNTKIAMHKAKVTRVEQMNEETPRRSYYMVETPEDSPGKDQEIITIQTGLSPLLQKVNLKRKHDEKTESEEEEMETTRKKKQRYGT